MAVKKLDKSQEDGDFEETYRSSKKSDKSTSNSDISDNGIDYDEFSEMDEEECERLRNECIEDLVDLERQFILLREQLFRERCVQVGSKLLDNKNGKAQECLQPLQQLQDNMRIRTEVISILKKFPLASVSNYIDAKALAGVQNLQG